MDPKEKKKAKESDLGSKLFFFLLRYLSNFLFSPGEGLKIFF